MPKPIFQDNGSGMHVHQSLWKGGEPLFFDEKGYAGLSDMARWYIGGLLKHAPAICAFSNPTTNSYKRLVPGYEAPVNLVYSQRNRSASVRIPLYSKSPKAKRLEFRCPDPSCNPYLAFSAMLMAGLDGIQNRIEPPTPVDRDLYDLPPEELAKVPQVPGSLNEALAALEADHEFLLKGDVFTPDVIDTWIAYKTGARDRPGAAPPAPVGVLPLLRHLDVGALSTARGLVVLVGNRCPHPSWRSSCGQIHVRLAKSERSPAHRDTPCVRVRAGGGSARGRDFSGGGGDAASRRFGRDCDSAAGCRVRLDPVPIRAGTHR